MTFWLEETNFHFNFSTIYSRILGKINFIYRKRRINLKSLRNSVQFDNERLSILLIKIKRKFKLGNRRKNPINYFQYDSYRVDNRRFFCKFFLLFSKSEASLSALLFFLLRPLSTDVYCLISDKQSRGGKN